MKILNYKTPEIPAFLTNRNDGATIDSIIIALYAVISGNAEEKRDWNRLRSLFVQGGRMIPLVSKCNRAGFETQILTIDNYIKSSGSYAEKHGFFESEIARKTEQFGNIAHVFSTFEGRHKKSDQKPFLSGGNSIQLINDGGRWWIVNLLWESVRPDDILPSKNQENNNLMNR